MIQTKEVQIDDHVYMLTQLPCTQGLEVLTRLAKIVGGPLAKLAGAGGLDADMSEVLGPAVVELCSRLDETLVVKTVKELVKTALVDGKQIQFETHFAGKYGHLFKLLKEILAHQYGDFSDALGAFSALTPRAAASSAPST